MFLMDARTAPGVSDPVPKWLVDGMLGRLSRYLRFLGFDSVYVRDAVLEVLIEQARVEGRVLLTRNGRLGSQVPGLVLRSTDLPSQLREVYAAFPNLPRVVRFDRCTVCNGELRPVPTAARVPGDAALPDLRPGTVVFACRECGHRYWEGTHTDRVRRDLQGWLAEDSP